MANGLVRQEAMRDDQIDLIKRTIALGATDNELKLFLYQCERTGLDPLAKQIYSIKRGGKMTTQIGIDGARLVAQRTGYYAGQDGPYWCGKNGVWQDVWFAEEHPMAAKVNVYLLGVERGTPGIAHWKEYAQPNGEMWKKMPALMLAKCAEMLALRKAFPQELSGLYTQEEMGQADNVIEVAPSHNNADIADKELVKLLDELGMSFYGAEWLTRSINLARSTSKQRTTAIDELTATEVATIIEFITKKIDDIRKVEAQPA